MRRLLFTILVLFIFSPEVSIFPHTKPNNIHGPFFRNIKIEKLSDIFLSPILYDYNAEVPFKMDGNSFSLYLLNKNFEDHIEGIKYNTIQHLYTKPSKYLFLIQQIDYLNERMQEKHQNESTKLESVIQDLEYSKDLASLLILFIHFSKY